MITEEQREARRHGLGGSDIAAILGLSPWATPVTVWLDKKGKTPPSEENEAMWWGTQEEDLVARRFTELTGKKTVNHNATIVDGVLIANLDRLVIPEGAKQAAYHQQIRTSEIFEAKTTGSEWPEAEVAEVLPNGYEVLNGDQGVPAHYQTQCLHYLGRVPSAQKIYVAAKMAIPCKGFSRTKFGVYVIHRDDEIISAQDAFARDWWEKYIVGDRIPDATNDDEARKLWRVSRPKTFVTVSLPLANAWRRLLDAKATIKEAEAVVEEAEVAIKNEMRDNEALMGDDGKTVLATWKSAKDRVKTVTDWERLAREKGVTDEEIAAATTTVTSPGSRTFLAKGSESVTAYVDQYITDNQPEPVAEQKVAETSAA